MAKCDRCKSTISASERAKAWPVAMGDEYVCPSCYGDEAFCSKGHVLRGDDDSGECATCARRTTRAAKRHTYTTKSSEGTILYRGGNKAGAKKAAKEEPFEGKVARVYRDDEIYPICQYRQACARLHGAWLN